MNDGFNALPWHDAELLEISIDRRDPGQSDEVRLRVAWPQGDTETLLFRDCYGFAAQMNFGIIAKESILAASVTEDDPGLLSIRKTWGKSGVSLDLLRCYRLDTNSTASNIRIYAKTFEIV